MIVEEEKESDDEDSHPRQKRQLRKKNQLTLQEGDPSIIKEDEEESVKEINDSN